MKKIILLLALVSCSCIIFAQSAAKKAKIEEFLLVTGSKEMGMQAMEDIIAMYRDGYSTVPEKFWNSFLQEAKSSDDFIEMLIPIYDKYYTEEDLEQLIAFYKSPIGKKMVAQQSDLMKESMQVGQVWGANLAAKILEKMKEEGY